MESVNPDEIMSRAVLIAGLIASPFGDPELRQHAADYGRCLRDGRAVPEATRRGFALALTQPLVVHMYTTLDLDTLHNSFLRSLARSQIALSVLMES